METRLYMHMVSDLSAERAKRQRYPVAISTSSAQIIISYHHFPLRGTRASGERTDSKAGTGRHRMSMKPFVMSKSKQVLAHVREACHRGHLGGTSTGQLWGV